MKNKEPIIILIIMCVFSFASNAKSITVNNLIQTKGKIVVASAGGDLPLSRNQSDVVTNQIIDESTYYSINVDESTVKQELKTIPNNSITIAAEPVKSENLSVAPIITKYINVDESIVQQELPIIPNKSITIAAEPVKSENLSVAPIISKDINVDESIVQQELPIIPNKSITITAEPVKSENLSVAPIITKNINVDESIVQQELPIIPNKSITIAAEPVKSENLSVAPIITKTNLFDVINTDLSLREVLSRWAVEAKWTHNPEHWAVDRDFPIAGTADAKFFTADFKTAVRKLLTSTDVTDRPLQPCFYSNNVLRVISKSELCNRTKSF